MARVVQSLDKKPEYFQLTKAEKIERFLAAVAAAFSGMGEAELWPASPPQVEMYFSDILAVSLFEKFKKDKKRFGKALDCVEAEILRTLLYSAGIIGLKVVKMFEGYKISVEEFEDFVVAILDSIARRRQGDEFTLEGTNPVFGREEVEELVRKERWEKVRDSTIKKVIARLNVAAESLTWTLFYDNYRSAGMRIHGPYLTLKGVLLCRDFFDLNPPMWNLQNKYPGLKALLIYKDDVKITVDFVNHLLYSSPIVDKLQFYAITAQKPLRSLRGIEELEDYYLGLGKRQAASVESLPPLEVIKKGAEIHYYMLKDFFGFYGEDWRPPEEVYERINRLKLKYWQRYRKPSGHPHKESGSWARRAYDPRSNYI